MTTRRRAVRLRIAANLYHRHYNAWRCAHGWRDCRAFVYGEGLVYYESLTHTGKVDVNESSHGELLDRMANIRRRRRLSLAKLRTLEPSKRSIARYAARLEQHEQRARVEAEAQRFTDAYLDGHHP